MRVEFPGMEMPAKDGNDAGKQNRPIWKEPHRRKNVGHRRPRMAEAGLRNGEKMIYALAAALVAAGDLWLKNGIEKKMDMHMTRPVLRGRGVLRQYHNRGAAMNLGEGRSSLVCILSVLLTLTASVVFCLTLTQKGQGLLKAGLSLLVGGAFSNTYDRLRRKYVVDYFSFSTGWKALDGIVFNLADFAILIGALCTVLASGRMSG